MNNVKSMWWLKTNAVIEFEYTTLEDIFPDGEVKTLSPSSFNMTENYSLDYALNLKSSS